MSGTLSFDDRDEPWEQMRDRIFEADPLDKWGRIKDRSTSPRARYFINVVCIEELKKAGLRVFLVSALLFGFLYFLFGETKNAVPLDLQGSLHLRIAFPALVCALVSIFLIASSWRKRGPYIFRGLYIWWGSYATVIGFVLLLVFMLRQMTI